MKADLELMDQTRESRRRASPNPPKTRVISPTDAWKARLIVRPNTISIATPALPLRVALAIIVAWLLVYAGVMWSVARVMWPMRTVPWALIAWGTVDLLVTVGIAVSPTVTIFGFLFLGAVYAAMFGAWQLALGWWLGRHASAIIVDQVTLLHRVHESSAETRRRVLSVR